MSYSLEELHAFAKLGACWKFVFESGLSDEQKKWIAPKTGMSLMHYAAITLMNAFEEKNQAILLEFQKYGYADMAFIVKEREKRLGSSLQEPDLRKVYLPGYGLLPYPQPLRFSQHTLSRHSPRGPDMLSPRHGRVEESVTHLKPSESLDLVCACVLQ